MHECLVPIQGHVLPPLPRLSPACAIPLKGCSLRCSRQLGREALWEKWHLLEGLECTENWRGNVTWACGGTPSRRRWDRSQEGQSPGAQCMGCCIPGHHLLDPQPLLQRPEMQKRNKGPALQAMLSPVWSLLNFSWALQAPH